MNCARKIPTVHVDERVNESSAKESKSSAKESKANELR
jgi:hypothetical protein